jgi:NADPH:quinone reductase-like Zn-dependent oxidoreductase
MRTECRAIVQSEYGAPEKVLRIAKRQFKTEELGTDDVLVRVIARPVHPGDIQILSALPQGGPVEPIPEGVLRVPGLEGVGTIVWFGANPEVAKRFSEGQRVAFFPATGSWAEYVVVRYNSLLPVPDKISNEIAAQMLINSITTSVLIKAGHNSLKAPISLPVYILQNAAASGVGRLLPARRFFQRSIATGKNRFAKPSKDPSSKWLSMRSADKPSTIWSLLMRVEPSSISVHWRATPAQTSIL